MEIFDHFAEAFDVLNSSYRQDIDKHSRSRMQEIFDFSERLWQEQIESLPMRQVNYILICEAPPWSDSGDINYFYNPKTTPSNLIQSVCKAFFGELIYKDIGYEQTLIELANQGFLLVDSIPFARNYSNDRKRNSNYYRALVNMTTHDYMLEKLLSNALAFSPNLKVAFSLRKNAEVIIRSLKHELDLGHSEKPIKITESNIAVDDSNYVSAKELVRIYGLTKS